MMVKFLVTILFRAMDSSRQGIMPSTTALIHRSIWNERGNSGPLLTTVFVHRILQLGVFVFVPFARTSIRRGADARI
jgi:hypothetical protein